MRTSGKLFAGLLVIIVHFSGMSQVSEGVITFERRTNMLKKSSGIDLGRMKFSEKNKYHNDRFFLYFNDSLSFFTPIQEEEVSMNNFRGIGTTSIVTRNSIFQNFKTNYRYMAIPVLNEELYMVGNTKQYEWKITEDKRLIGIYECRKAVLFLDKETRIYAWYTDEVIPSVGPESFCGLPGAILGLATEDGGVTYFATSVEEKKINFDQMRPKPAKNRLTEKSFAEKISLLKSQNVMIRLQLNDPFLF